MGRKTMLAAALAAAFAAAGAAQAAAPDWSKVPAKQITAFYPGASPMEWIMKGTEHGGARALKIPLPRCGRDRPRSPHARP